MPLIGENNPGGVQSLGIEGNPGGPLPRSPLVCRITPLYSAQSTIFT